MNLLIRRANEHDVESIRDIYNQGIADRIATLESEPKDEEYMLNWYKQRDERHVILVAVYANKMIGWACINPYSHRCADMGIGDISIYIHQDHRGQGNGERLLHELEKVAIENGFYKLVLFTFLCNQMGLGLYRKIGFQEVGVFQKHGRLDGKFIDIMAMEKVIEVSVTYTKYHFK